jgi:outer membrane protein assembly factor BamB
MEQRGQDELTVCYEALTGRVRWIFVNGLSFTSVMGGDGPRATPTIDQGRVFVMGANGRLDCLEGASGKRIWTQDTVKDTKAPLPTWGIAASPLIVDHLVVVSPGGPDGHSLEAFDKQSGALVWHAGSSPASYASPMLATLAGKRQIVILNKDNCSAHDPATGKLLWRFAWPGEQPKVPQPIVVGENRLLLSAGYGLGSKLIEIVPSEKSSAEASSEPKSADEPADEMFEFAARELWASRALKPKFDNPMVHDGSIYGIDDGMALTCLDLKTGKRKWRGGRYGHAQLLLVGELLVVQTEVGDIALVDAKPDAYHEYTWFHAISERAWNTPALSGKLLLVRNHLEAAAFELP